MRGEFVLPAVLSIALIGMVVYVTTVGGRQGEAGIGMTPIQCETPSSLLELPDLAEASGLTASRRQPGLFWTHNDSSDPVLHAISAEGTVEGRVRVSGAVVDDWEAVTAGRCGEADCLYVADIGDNDRVRRTIRVYRVPEPSPDDEATPPATVLEAVYPEGAQDAEALFLARGALYVVTKGDNAPVRIYRFPALTDNTTHRLQLVATVGATDAGRSARITDAAASPDGRWIALRTVDFVLFYAADALLAGRVQTPLGVDVRALDEPQGEGIAWPEEGSLALAGEGEGHGTFARISCNLPR